MEIRGRKQILSMANMRALDKARRQLYVKGDNDHEGTWDEIIRKARAPPVDRSTASKCMKAASFDIAWHAPRTERSCGEMDPHVLRDVTAKMKV